VSEKNIYQMLIEIRKSIDVFTKDSKSYSYSYVSGAQVLKKIKEKMDSLGVVLENHVTSHNHSTFEYESKGKQKTDFIVWGNMKMVWVNADKPEDRTEVEWQLFGQQDDISKAFGSGLTYSERYFLLKYFGIPTDEDDPDAKQNQRTDTTNTSRKLSEAQVNRLFAIAKASNISVGDVKKVLMKDYNKTNPADLTKDQYDELCKRIEAKKGA
jgi:hypothetical protein